MEEYFDRNILDFLECYEAFEKKESSDLGQHWVAAQKRTNLVFYGFNLQESSMLELDISEEANF